MINIKRTAFRTLLSVFGAMAAALMLMTVRCFAFEYSDISGSAATGANISGYERALSVNVCDQGADKTGAKDSYEAIQKCLDLAVENGSDKVQFKVVIPEGKYLISKPLNIYSNTWLYMKGATIIRGYNKGYMLRNALKDPNVGGFNGEHNIIIEGGCFDGNTDSTATDFSNVRLGHCHDIWIKDVEFRDNYNGHLLELGGAKNVTIENCQFHEFHGDSLKEAVQLDALNNASVFVSFEPFDDTTCQNIIIRNNRFYDFMRGFGSHSATLGVYFTDITLTGNTFDNIYDRAILMQNYRRTLIADNTIKNCGTGIDFRNMTLIEYQGYNPPVAGYSGIQDKINDYSDTVIRDNKISVTAGGYTSDPYCIQLYGRELTASYYPLHDYKVTGVRIEGNTLESPGTTVALYDTDKVLIQSNTSSSGDIEADQIIVRQSDNCTVKDNKVTGGEYSAIYVGAGEGHVVSGNTCKDAGAAGIYVSLGAQGAEIKDNTVEGSGGSGIKITKTATANVEGNKVSSSGDAGIEMLNGSGTLKKNTVKGSSGSGIRVDGDVSVTLRDNKLTANGGCGVYSMNGATVSVSGNSYSDNVRGRIGGENGGTVKTGAVKKLTCDGVYQDHLQLSWSGLAEADAYSVKRRAVETGEDFYEIAQTYSASFVDLGLSSRTRYEYRVDGLILTGDGQVFQGEPSEKLSIRTKTDMSDCTADLEPVLKFSGKPLTPPFNVYIDGDVLIPGVDYTVKYSKNTAVGTASVMVVGQGQYYGFKEYSFRIEFGEGMPAETITARQIGLTGTDSETYEVEPAGETDTGNQIYDSLLSAKGDRLFKVRKSGGLWL